jgi:hypothetical protein
MHHQVNIENIYHTLSIVNLFIYVLDVFSIVKAASPKFLALIQIGSMIALIGLFVPANPDGNSCGIYAWTLAIGFDVAIASILVKSWRISSKKNDQYL